MLNALKKLREVAKKRNFTQSIDLQIALRETDVRKPENKIDEYVVLPHKPDKKVSVAALVDKELSTDAKKIFDEVILKDEFPSYAKNKRQIKKLVRRHKYFVAQANIMTDIAKVFGKYLGPKGRMPSPKAGCVIPPNPSVLKPIYEKLQRTVRIRVKDQPTVNVVVGTENMKDEELADNILAVYNALEKALPRGKNQINKAYVKMTMSRSVAI